MPFVPTIFNDTMSVVETCTKSEYRDIISIMVYIESNREIIMSKVDDAMVELCKETTAEKGDIDEGSVIFIVVGEENNQKQNTSWAQCMACFEIISNLLSEKEFREENVALESCNG